MENKPTLAPELIHDFVANAHSDLERVETFLEREPGLINAAWDWGDGDWETALGAAAHMGRRDIAQLLLRHGARLDLFAAAMLGEGEIVEAIIKAFPSMSQARGPHGISLLTHAQAGGEQAAAVVAFLQAL